MPHPFYLLLIILLHLSFSSADLLVQKCEGGNFTADSKYHSNLNKLLNYFTSLNSTSYTTYTKGKTPNIIYGLFLCRGDVSYSDCSNCIQNAAADASNVCPHSKQATLWYDYCELRYSNNSFFSSYDNSGNWILINVNSVTKNVDSFISTESKLLDKLTNEAAYNSSTLFATGIAINGTDNANMYGLAQCTRDLSTDDCNQCLEQIRGQYAGYEARRGGRVLGASCNFRYETYTFYSGKPTILLNFTTTSPPSSPPSRALPPPSGGFRVVQGG